MALEPVEIESRCTVVLGVLASLLAPCALAQTVVGGTLSGDTAWTLAGSPYELSSTVVVPSGTALTIEPGVLIRANGSATTGLVVEGTLTAAGSETSPIVFESVAAAPESWLGVVLSAGSTGSTLSWLTIEHATCGLDVRTPEAAAAHLRLRHNGAGMRLQTSYADLSDVVIHDNEGAGIEVLVASTPASLSIDRCLVYDNELGIGIDSAPSSGANHLLTLNRCTVATNGEYGVGPLPGESASKLDVTAYRSIFSHNGDYQIYYVGKLSLWEATIFSLSDLGYKHTAGFISGNGIVVYNPLYVDMEARDFRITRRSPARYGKLNDGELGYFDYEGHDTPGLLGFYWENEVIKPGVHQLTGDIIVPGRLIPGSGLDANDPSDDLPSRLTLHPGVTIEVTQSDAMGSGSKKIDGKHAVEIINHGILEMDGVLTAPVRLRSAAPEPGPGMWYGVRHMPGAHSINLSEIEVRHAVTGAELWDLGGVVQNYLGTDNEVGLTTSRGAPTLRNVILRDNTEHGLSVQDSTLTAENLQAHGNGGHGIFAHTEEDITLTRCLLDGNAEYGLYLSQKSSAGSYSTPRLDINESTIHGNGAGGVRVSPASYLPPIAVTNSVISQNAPTYPMSSSSTQKVVTVKLKHTNVWRDAAEVWDDGFDVADEGGNVSLPPLFKDPASREYQPTSRSPLRCRHENGIDDIGYAAFEGDETGALLGVINGDMTFTAAGSPYLLAGDLHVDGACSSEPQVLTIEPGAVVQVAPSNGFHWDSAKQRNRIIVTEKMASTGGTLRPLDPSGYWGGIVANPGAVVELQGLELHRTWSYAVHGTNVERLVVEGGAWTTPNGILVEGGQHVRIEGATLRSGRAVEAVSITEPVIVRGNVIVQGKGQGIRVVDSDANISNNVLLGAGGFSDTSFAIAAVGFAQTRTVEVWNNTVHGARFCLMIVGEDYPSDPLHVAFHNNMFLGCTYRTVSRLGNTKTSDSHTIYNAYGPNTWSFKGPNTVLATPEFEDLDTVTGEYRWFDVRMFASSPAIDAGTSGPGAPATDIAGVARPIGAELDIGAHEHDPAANRDPLATGTGPTVVPWKELHCFNTEGTVDPEGDPLIYEWDFGDGTTAYGPSACHVFQSAAMHHVVVTVTDVHGNVDHHVVPADVDKRPVAIAGPEAYASIEEAKFDGSSSYDSDGYIAQYDWDFGDGTTGTGPAPGHQYPPEPSKDYLVTLTVTDNNGLSHSDATVAHIIGAEDLSPPLLVHVPVANGQPPGQPVLITAEIADFAGVPEASLHYRPTGAGDFSEVPLLPADALTWSASIPAEAVTEAGVDYYLTAIDGAAPPNLATSPADVPESFHHFSVVPPDTTGPAIEHAPLPNGWPEAQAALISAKITDPCGVAKAMLYYKTTPSATWSTALMGVGSNATWSAFIPAAIVVSEGIDYYISATDASPAANTSSAPATAPAAFHSVSVGPLDTAAPVIGHEPIANGRYPGLPLVISAQLSDQSGIQAARVHYRVKGATGFATAAMAGTGAEWAVTLPGGEVAPPGLEYYLEAVDKSSNHLTSTAPAGAPVSVYSFTVLDPDLTGPEIVHVPATAPVEVGSPQSITATVTDPSGVGEVSLHYGSDAGYQAVAMTSSGNEQWTATLPPEAVALPGVSYYLEAVDLSPTANTSLSPPAGSGDPWWLGVAAPDVAGPVITHEPIQDGQLAGKTVAITATATDPSGVASISVEWRISGQADALVQELAGTPPTALLPPSSVTPAGVEYRVTAADSKGNQSAHPDSGWHAFTVTADDTGPLIEHELAGEGQAGAPLPIAATISDGAGVAGARVFFRPAGEPAFTSLSLASSGGGLWSGSIPAFYTGGPSLDYYLEATDSLGNVAVAPAGGASAPHTVPLVGSDASGPNILHTPPAGPVPAGVAIPVEALVTDPGGLASVEILFRPQGTAVFTSATLTSGDGGLWTGAIPGIVVTGAAVEYYLRAVDQHGHVTLSPTAAPASLHLVTIQAPDTTGPTVDDTPVGPQVPAGVPIDITASIYDDTGVATAEVRFRAPGSGPFTGTALTNAGDDTWTGQIPAYAITNAGLEYYVLATDPLGNTGTSPADAPAQIHSVETVTGDTSAPEILLTPPGAATAHLPVGFQASITDDTGVSSATLHYRPVDASLWHTQAFSGAGQAVWVTTLSGAHVGPPAVEYYITASDVSGNVGASPPKAPEVIHLLAVEPDEEGPVLEHLEVGDDQPLGEAVPVTAVASDPAGVASVTTWYRPQGSGPMEPLTMDHEGDGAWFATIPAAAVSPAGVEYYLEASDGDGNVATLPAGAPGELFSFSVADAAGPVITHTPPDGPQASGQQVGLEASATDPSGVASVSLMYRSPGQATFTEATLVGDGESWSGSIPATAVAPPGVEYYLRAQDGAGNESVSPADAPAAVHTVSVATDDTAAPVIDHVPIAGSWPSGVAVPVTAGVTDDVGAVIVRVYYRSAAGAAFSYADLAPGAAGQWSGAIPGWAVSGLGIEYYLTATDAAGNVGLSPDGAPTASHGFAVEAPDELGPSILHEPVPDGQAIGKPVPVVATVTDGSGVAAVRLAYRPTGEESYSTLDLTAGEGTDWSGTIPGFAVTEAGVEYYLAAEDVSPQPNLTHSPVTAPAVPHAFSTAAIDESGPAITVAPVVGAQPAGEPIAVAATVVDASGVAGVRVHFRAPEQAWETLPMEGDGNVYAAEIPGDAVVVPLIHWYVSATDASPGQLETTAPADGWFETDVVVIPLPADHGPSPAAEQAPDAGAVEGTAGDVSQGGEAEPPVSGSACTAAPAPTAPAGLIFLILLLAALVSRLRRRRQ